MSAAAAMLVQSTPAAVRTNGMRRYECKADPVAARSGECQAGSGPRTRASVALVRIGFGPPWPIILATHAGGGHLRRIRSAAVCADPGVRRAPRRPDPANLGW
ncbi:hypothetical protein GCM10023171_34830 [Microbacterium panaciterrae]|uniref:Uncharacterized protein n=1 Tax=Microbacterium panaciterrae TaxID=985759 RepID=A0ABP8PQX4_9MICO